MKPLFLAIAFSSLCLMSFNKKNIVAIKKTNSFDFIKTFEGEINNKYGIIAKIQSNDGLISGKYYYKNVGQELKLTGIISENGKVVMQEFDENNTQTGIFKGNLVNENKISGTWQKPNSDKTMPFYLLASNTDYLSIKNKIQDLKSIAGEYRTDNIKAQTQTSSYMSIYPVNGNKFKFELNTASASGCTGEMSGEVRIDLNKVGNFSTKDCKLKFEFFDNMVSVTEIDCFSGHGMNCWFSGDYKKTE